MTQPPNGFQAVQHVLDYAPKDLSLAQRLVLIQIASHYPNPWLEQKSIAAEIGIRRIDTVYKAIKVLEKRKLLVVYRQGMMKANKYRLHDDFADTAETGSMTTRQTGIHDTRQTAIKQTIKQTKKQSVLVFDSDPDSVFGKYVWLKRPSLSKLQLWEWLKAFEREKTFIIENARTEKLIEHVLAYIPSTEGDE